MIDIEPFKLRKLTESDKENLAKYANEFDIWLNLTDSFPHPYTLENANWYINHCAHETFSFNLCIDLHGEFIGMIGIVFFEGVRQQSADFGYWLAKPFWGQGIVTKCSRAFISYVFENYELNRLQSLVFEWNPASMRVLEKLGFQREGIGKKAILKNDQLIDEYRFGLLRENFAG